MSKQRPRRGTTRPDNEQVVRALQLADRLYEATVRSEAARLARLALQRHGAHAASR